MWGVVVFAPSVGLVSIVIFKLLRRFLYPRVNCWFCNKYTEISRRLLQCWTCPHCDQYNGFSDSGDYNKSIAAMHDERLNAPTQKRVRVKSEPDVTALDPPNGLCHSCNDAQALKIAQLAKFVPSSEARFDDEMRLYKRRLETVYRLCAKCESFLANRLRYEAGKLPSPPPPLSTFTTTTPLPKSRAASHTHRPAIGRGIRLCFCICILLSTALCVVDLQNIQADSHSELIDLHRWIPYTIVPYIDLVYTRCWLLPLTALVLHASAMCVMTGRVLLTDLVALPCWVASVGLQGVSADLLSIPTADLFVWQLGIAAVCCMLSVCAAVLPRKVPRPRRSKISGCFSMASTPPGSADNSMYSPSVVSSASTVLRHRHLASQPGASSPPFKNPFKLAATPPAAGRFGRETTPSRDLGSRLDLLSLGAVDAPRMAADARSTCASSYSSRRVVVSPARFTVPPSSFGAMSDASGPPFGMGSLPGQFEVQSGRRAGIRQFGGDAFDSASVDGSAITSISQRQSGSCQTADLDGFWKALVAIALAASLFSNALVLYYFLAR